MDVAFLQGATSTSDLTTYTFASQNLGAADADRYIVVCFESRSGGSNVTISSVSVAGVSATIVTQFTNTSNASNTTGIAIAAVPTGTTGDVVVTLSAGAVRAAMQLYRLVGIDSPTPADTADGTTVFPTTSASLDVPAGGVAIGCAMQDSATATATWTGLAEDYDAQVETVTGTAAHETFETEQTGLAISCEFSSANRVSGSFASWAPAEDAGDSVIPHAMQGLESGFIFGSENIAGAGLHNIEAGIVG